jgi:DNA-binding CsgD family transcriptional regulator
MTDIELAKESLNMVAGSAGMMSSQEMMTVVDFNEWGVQNHLNQLYKKLLSFKVTKHTLA